MGRPIVSYLRGEMFAHNKDLKNYHVYEQILGRSAGPAFISEIEMEPSFARPPTGTVTFLFSDIEGSTARWDAHHSEMQQAVRRHDALMRATIQRNGGHVFKTIGDAFCAAFPTAPDALAAALDAQRALRAEDWSEVGGLCVRMAIHTGTADERDADYFGPTVNRVARLLAIGHGGQVLLSGAAKESVEVPIPGQATLLDLGRHRLKDLTAPEHVFQLCTPDLPAQFRPLNSLDALRHNLPEQVTPLIGRGEELAELIALVKHSRLVTLTGAGGVGKTRVALQVAADLLRNDDDGVWFIDLSALDDPALVASKIASVFDVPDVGGSEPLIRRVASTLKKSRVLIVLDNCEHVISAAADAVDALLRTCPAVRVLATSREPLGVSGEHTYQMPSLAVPPAGEQMTAERVTHYGAVALFVSRARSAQRSFLLTDENAAIVADIVRRLDGIALAIELAAPRIKVLSLQQLMQRLDERFTILTGGSRTALPRQQTLRALISWSYDLLSQLEKVMFRQLAIFRGGWTMEAAEAICVGERVAEWNAFDLLSSLINKSLVVVEIEGDTQRYRLLESTRHFAIERLDEAGERADVAARHCHYFAKIAEREHAAYWLVNADSWAAVLRPDLDNFNAAIDWAFNGIGDAVAGALIFASLRVLWRRREWPVILTRANAALGSDTPKRVRGLLALAEAYLQDASARAIKPASEAVRELSIDGEAPDLANALVTHGEALGKAGLIAESVALTENALSVARATGIPRLIALCLTNAAYWVGTSGDGARGRAFLDEAAALLRASDDRRQLAQLQANRTELLFADGDHVRALACAREAETLLREISPNTEHPNLCAAILNSTSYLLALDLVDEAWASARDAVERALRADVPLWIAIAIGHLAHLAAENNDLALAARLLGYVDAVYEKCGDVREPIEQRGFDRALELIRAALPETRIRALMTEGAKMDQDVAVAEAMAIPQPRASQGEAARSDGRGT